MAGRPAKRSKRNSQFAVEYLHGHPTATNEDVIKATGCSERSVSRARAMLVATGALQRSYFDRQHRSAGPIDELQEGAAGLAPARSAGDLPVEGPRDPLALEKALRADHGPALTTEQMKQRYSAIARYGAKTGEFTLEIQAMQALGRLDAQTGARDRLGPGAPHTREDRRDRVQPILEAAGPSIVAEAVVLAYDEAEFQQFIGKLGEFALKAKERRTNGITTQENQPATGDERSSGSEIPHETVAQTEVGPRDGDVGAEACADSGSDGGATHGGGDSGPKGS
jgi:hypothetical protein